MCVCVWCVCVCVSLSLCVYVFIYTLRLLSNNSQSSLFELPFRFRFAAQKYHSSSDDMEPAEKRQKERARQRDMRRYDGDEMVLEAGHADLADQKKKRKKRRSKHHHKTRDRAEVCGMEFIYSVCV